LLYYYLDDLQSYKDRIASASPDTNGFKHLELLVNHIKRTYEPTTQCLVPLQQNGEISYDHPC
jgi:hypothetical protein